MIIVEVIFELTVLGFVGKSGISRFVGFDEAFVFDELSKLFKGFSVSLIEINLM